jgi:hypothetical protein
MNECVFPWLLDYPGIEGNEFRGGGEVISASGAIHSRGGGEVAPAMRSSDMFRRREK